MKVLYQSTFTSVGPLAHESLEDNFLITFGEGAPRDVAEYCFIHKVDVNRPENILPGNLITIGSHQYSITAVGDVARENLRDLGHITIRFDGAGTPEFPGTIHVTGNIPTAIEAGQKFLVLSE